MIIRAAKAKFGPITKRYTRGDFKQITRSVETDIDQPSEPAKRGVAAGLDNSHSKDYKVTGVSDPLLIIYTTTPDKTHKDLKEQLDQLGLWNFKLIPIELPQTARNGEATWTPGFKTLPKDASMLDRFKTAIKDRSCGMCFESDTDIEAEIPDLQQNLSSYTSPTPSETQEQPSD